jgi:hypothetical protein
MQQPNVPTNEAIVVVHTARSPAEAMVIRGLLESAGIASPELGGGGNSPWPSAVSVLHPARGVEIPIYAIESQAGRARELITEYLTEIEQGTEPSGEQGDSGEDD